MLGVERKPYLVGVVSKEKLRDWLNSLPETARDREPAEILAVVFIVETVKRGEGRNAR
ncbi:hypothetical protein [Geoglobus sp.]